MQLQRWHDEGRACLSHSRPYVDTGLSRRLPHPSTGITIGEMGSAETLQGVPAEAEHPAPRRAFPEVHPLLGAGLALGLAGAFGLFATLRWQVQPHLLAYDLPIALPFAAFFLDRACNRWPRLSLVDGMVLALAIARVVIPPFPFASGHVLFTSYAAMTARGWVLRWSALVVLVVSLTYKLAIWQDLATPLPALGLGLLTAWLEHRRRRRD